MGILIQKGGKIKMMDEDEVDAAFAVQKRAEEGARGMFFKILISSQHVHS